MHVGITAPQGKRHLGGTDQIVIEGDFLKGVKRVEQFP